MPSRVLSEINLMLNSVTRCKNGFSVLETITDILSLPIGGPQLDSSSASHLVGVVDPR